MARKWMAAGVLAWGMLTAGAAQAYSCDWVGVGEREGVEPSYPWKNAQVVDGASLAGPGDLAPYAGRPIVVRGGAFPKADFSQLGLSDVCFEDTDLTGSIWTGGTGIRLAFVRADLSGARLAGADLSGAQFQGAKLNGADATEARLVGAQMEGVSYSGLVLTRADLTDFNLHCSEMNGEECTWPDQPVDVRGAVMTRTRLDVYAVANWRFDGARLDGAHMLLRHVPNLRGAVAAGPIDLEGVPLSPAEWRALIAGWNFAPGGAPAFDCARATSVVELRVCAGAKQEYSQLGGLDVRLARLYRQALAAGVTTAEEQKAWLLERERCAFADIDACLLDVYSARIDALGARLAPPPWLKPGVEAVYVDSDPPVSEAFRRTALYHKLLPAILHASNSTLWFKAIDATRLEVRGDAWGPNGHSCDLGDSGGGALALNTATGWFGGPHTPFGDDKRTWEAVIRLSGDEVQVEATTTDLLSDYVGCGARAFFQTMRRIPVGFDALSGRVSPAEQ